MTRSWLLRILRGTTAAVLLAACLGGVEALIALRGSISLLVNAVERLELWAWNVAYTGLLGLVLGLGLSAACGALLGHKDEHRELEFHTGRDPRYPWLPPVLTGSFVAVLGMQLAPWVAAGLPSGISGSRFLLAGAFTIAGAIVVAVGSFRWLKRLDHTGKGAAAALLGLPTVLVLTMTFAVSAPLRGGTGEPAREHEALPNLLLITVDALRADHVGPGSRASTPTLDWMARKGVHFLNVTTPSTSEGPPNGAILSGLHPLSSGFLADGQALPSALPGGRELPSLAGKLRSEGYATAAFVSSVALDGRESGLARGFTVYDDGVGERFRGQSRLSLAQLGSWLRHFGAADPPAEDVLRPAEQTIARYEQWSLYHYRENSFVWLQLSDPRIPFLAVDEELVSSARDPIPGAEGRAYAARVAALDQRLGTLLQGLEDDGLLEWTLVVVVGSRGYVPGGGAPSVGEPWTQVPLVLYGPGLKGGRSVESQVRLQDLPATLLSAVGFRKHKIGDGVSLLPLIEGRGLQNLQAMSISPPWADGRCEIALRTPSWKYTRNPKGVDAWFDLDRDPMELHNVKGEHEEQVGHTAEQLDQLLGRFVPTASLPVLEPGRAARLRALAAAR